MSTKSSGPRPGEDRLAFLERRLSRRHALKLGAAGTAATFAAMYVSPIIHTAHAQQAAGTPTPTPTPPPTDEETGYALGSGGICFIPILGSNWGWYHERSKKQFNENWDLWLGAGQCDTGKATHAGTVNVVRDNGALTFTFNLKPGFTLNLWHIYAESSLPGSVAPGQFGNQGTSTSTTISVPNGKIYIIVQAEVE